MINPLIDLHEMMIVIEELIGEKLDWSIDTSEKMVTIPDYSVAVICTGVNRLFGEATGRKMNLEE
jgi:hypothetical protein